MRSILSILTGLILASSIHAKACPRSNEKLLCPGDKVVDINGYVGTVSGVNPFQQTVSINYGGSTDNIKTITSTAIGFGCLEGYCIGDLAVDQRGYRGRIDAVNPYNRTVAINYGGSTDNIEYIENVALGLGCAIGYCVGDTVIDDNGYKGKMEAINRFKETAAVNYGGSNDNIKRIRSLSSSEICSTYGDEERIVSAFPVINESLYPSSNFKFTLKRPIK